MAATDNCFYLANKNQTKNWNLFQETLLDDDVDCVNYWFFLEKVIFWIYLFVYGRSIITEDKTPTQE